MGFLRPVIRLVKHIAGQDPEERRCDPISGAVVTVGHHVVEGGQKATKAIHAHTCAAGAAETVSSKMIVGAPPAACLTGYMAE